MDNAGFCTDWKQVRIFSKDQAQWYPTLLSTILVPAVEKHPNHPFFFSMYADSFEGDVGDTDISRLPSDFRTQIRGRSGVVDVHISVRVRFKGDGEFKDAMRLKLLQNEETYWHSERDTPFRDFDLIGDIGGPRFSPDQSAAARQRRARLVAEALRANNLVVMDAIVPGPPPHFETNGHNESKPKGSTFVSVGHMFNNVWADQNGQDLGVWVTALDQGGNRILVRKL